MENPKESRMAFWEHLLAVCAIDIEADFIKLSPFHFRIIKDNVKHDFYPVGMLYHKVPTNKYVERPDIDVLLKELFDWYDPFYFTNLK